MKRLSILILAILMVLGLSSGFALADTTQQAIKNSDGDAVTILVNEKPVDLNVEPVMTDGRLMVPFRAIGEVMGAKVDWDEKTETASLALNDTEVNLTLGELSGMVNGSPVDLDAAAKLVNGHVLIPLRFVNEALGAQVEWNAENKQVQIKTPAKESEIKNFTQKNWVDAKKEIKLRTGIKMKYIEMGSPENKTIVLIHGVTDTSRSWSLAAPYLAQDYHVIIPDLRGHGDSEKLKMRSLPMSLFAEDVVALMDALEINTAAIAGHSMGSYVAQAIAINYPEKVDELVLVSSAATRVGKTDTWNTVTNLGETPYDREFVEWWYWNPNPVDETFHEYGMDEVSRLEPWVWQAAYKGIMTTDHSSFLGDITSPTLIMWGNLDPILPLEYQEDLRQAIPDAEFVTLDNVGHNIQWEQPEKVSNMIKQFLQEQ